MLVTTHCKPILALAAQGVWWICLHGLLRNRRMGNSVDLSQLFLRPFGQKFFFQDADEVAPVQVDLFSVIEKLAEHLPPGCIGRTAEAAFCVEELEFRGLVLILQPVGPDDQHLAGVILGFFFRVGAVGLVIQPQLCPGLSGQIDEAIQHGRMAVNGECPVGVISGNADRLAPVLVSGRKASVVGLFPDGVGENEVYPVEAELGDDPGGTIALQGAAIKAAEDGILNGSGTLAVFLVAFLPEIQFMIVRGFGFGVDIELFVFSHWPLRGEAFHQRMVQM